MSSPRRVEDSAKARDPRLEAVIASWTAERPDPDHWIKTGGIEHARSALRDALRGGAGAVVVSGPSGHGKTTLLRSFWHRPPRGFAPVFVPPLDAVEPNQIAARILETARSGQVHDAAGALSRMLRAQSLRGARPVLLVDDLHELAPASLASLLALAAGSRVDVAIAAAGSTGAALNKRVRALPRPVREIEIDAAWTRADAERLIACIRASLPIDKTDLLEAIDVDEAVRSSDGNPRRVRAALAAQLRQRLNLPKIEPAISPPSAAISPPSAATAPDHASSEPAFENAQPPIASAAAPAPRAERRSAPAEARAPAAPIRAPAEAPPRKYPGRAPPGGSQSPRARAHRRRLSARARVNLAGALAGCLVFVVLVDRVPPIATWSAVTAGAYARDTADWIAARMPERSLADTSRSISDSASDRLHRVTRWATDWTLPEIPVSRFAESAKASLSGPLRWIHEWKLPDLSPAAGSREAPVAEAPIRVAVNSHPWSNVEVDGVEAGSTPLVIELSPGPHRFRAAMADGRVVEQDFDVAADRNRIALR